MAKKVPWDIYESVILLDALIAVYEGRVSRKNAIKLVSAELRTRAQRAGIDVDDIYRNISGISLQMSVMESILTDGEKGFKRHNLTKMFCDAVDMYKNDRQTYKKILLQVKKSLYSVPLQEKFFRWLAPKVSSMQLSELYPAFENLKRICVEQGIIKNNLFELTNISDIRSVVDTVSCYVPLDLNKRELGKMYLAAQFYYSFMTSATELLANLTCVQQQSEYQLTELPSHVNTTVTALTSEQELDDSTLNSASAQPKTIEFNSGSFASANTNKNLVKEGTIRVVDFSTKQQFAFTQPTGFSYFDETRLRLSKWSQLYVNVVACLLEDYPSILMSFVNRGIEEHDRYDFADDTGVKQMTAPEKVTDNFYVETDFCAEDIIFKIKRLLDLCNVDYENLEIFYEQKPIAETGNGSNLLPNNDNGRATEIGGNEKTFSNPLSKNGVQLEQTYSHYSDILLEYFGDFGYQLGSSIERARFKRDYAERFGCEPAESDECIDDVMSKVGIKRDGKIFPKLNANQNILINDIVKNILATFDAGTTAVQIGAVFEKYKVSLANVLKIYNEDTLESLLMDISNGMYTKKYSYLVKIGSDADVQRDLLHVMKEFQEPQNYVAIHEKAWFIAYDKMKSILTSSRVPSIVKVAPETYFYAPNLPISAEELAYISELLHKELNHHTYITEAGLMQLIGNKCPSVAIDTGNYASYGLRNCLAYILRDQFDFKGPIISQKGLSSTDIYIEFAKTHEVLSIGEISAWSDETKLPIIWEAIMGEMIRVSETKLVRKDLVKFDVTVIDEVLSQMCPKDYMPIREVDLFLHFPACGYPWNIYLLESYLFNYSKKFSLLHSSFAMAGAYGAMVRRNAGIKDYQSLIIDVLSRSEALSTTKEALKYIIDKGYQKRRQLKGIESLVQKAKLVKEKRHNQ